MDILAQTPSASFEAEKYAVIINVALDAIVVTDDKDSIILWNKAAETMLGYSEPEMLGKELHVILPMMEEHRTNKSRLAVFQKTGESDVLGKLMELPVRRKDGTQIEVELLISKIQMQGKWHAIGIMRDITKRKETERKLEERVMELERMNRLMVDRELTMMKLKEKLKNAGIPIDTEKG